jgi:hypothetical protein
LAAERAAESVVSWADWLAAASAAERAAETAAESVVSWVDW